MEKNGEGLHRVNMTEGTPIHGGGVDTGLGAMPSDTLTDTICQHSLECGMFCDSIQSHSVMGSDEESEQLLPGIPDEITLDRICTKLPWTAFHVLSSVSRCWKRTIQTGRVYDARVRSQSTETFVAYDREGTGGRDAIALYSPKDKSCHELPPFPGRLYECQCITMNWKIYVLGAVTRDAGYKQSAEVYVLDLAGQWQWQQCASMLVCRERFGCGVLDGKIYVFGGASNERLFRASEVYDPKVDAWFPIKPVPSTRVNFQVAVIGEELLLYGGHYNDRRYGRRTSGRYVNGPAVGGAVDGAPLFLQAYHPSKEEWRWLQPFAMPFELPYAPIYASTGLLDTVFMSKGKFHVMTGLGVHIVDVETNSWTDRYTHSFPSLGPTGSESGSKFDFDNGRPVPLATIAAGNELLTIMRWAMKGGSRHFLLQSNGFGGEGNEIVWEKLNSLSLRDFGKHFVCPVQC